MIYRNLKILVMLLMSILPMQLSAANTAPVAQDDSVTGEKNKEIIFTISDLVSTNDTDPDGDTLVLLNVFDPINGTVTFNKNDGTITFIPNADFTGEASFNYTIVDRVILDTAIPIPTIDFIDFQQATETGLVTSKSETPTFSGSCEPGYTVTIQVNGNDIAPTAVCDASGSYSLSPTESVIDATVFFNEAIATEVSPSNRISEPSITKRFIYSNPDI